MFSTTLHSPSSALQRDNAFEQWLAQVHRVCGSFAAQPFGERFAGQLQDLRCGALHMSLVEGARVSLLKQKQHLDKDSARIFYAVLQLQGQACIEQLDARIQLMPGDLAVLDSSKPFNVHMTDSQQISVILPSALMEPQRQVRAACAQRIAGSSMLGKWVQDLVLDAAIHRQQEMTALESDALLAALSGLLKPVVFHTAQGEDSSAQNRLYTRACRYIEDNLADASLSPEGIAQAIGVSVRGLYRAFAGQQQVVSQYIRNGRLERCAEALRSGGAAATNLGALSYAWGFADASHFSLAFKKYFGLSPSDYRKRHCH